MRAAVLNSPRELKVEEVEVPRAGDNEVVYKVLACGVCPSDVRRWSSSRTDGEKRILGHESVGEVVEVGKNVTGFAVGDRIARDWRDTCGECEYCRKGLFNFSLLAETPDRLGFMGGFCELSKARAAACRKIPDGLSFEEAAFTEPLACCINGIRQSRIDLGEEVAVLGCGPIGLQLLQLARMRGARVIAVDLKPERLETARALGAHDTVAADGADTVKALRDLTDGRGLDAVIVAAGVPALVSNAMDVLDYGGRVNIFAGIYPKAEVGFDPNRPHYRHEIITGSHDYTPHDFSTALKLIHRRIVDVRSLISHRLPLERTQEGFEVVSAQSGLKVVIFPAG